MKKTYKIAGAIVLALVVLMIILSYLGPKQKSDSTGTIKVVAAENFWGSLVSQIGGNKVSTISIVSDPNADPHEYETSTKDAKEMATANYVVLNGAGYDTWANKLIDASPNPNRKVLTVATLLGKSDGDNPHFWYSPSYVNLSIQQMESDLASIDPADSRYFENNLITLEHNLAVYQGVIKSISQNYHGEAVASTESIFVYLAQAAGLNLISPPAFMQAVSEGNDPPTDSVVQFQQQLKTKQVKLLVYNTQTVTPLTSTMKQLAMSEGIPTIGVSETIQPPNARFQDWMDQQVNELQSILQGKTN